MISFRSRFGSGSSIVAALLFSLAFAIPGFSQETTGAIDGTVLDSTGAAVPEASVEATSPSAGLPLRLTTDSQGHFRFASVAPGTYDLVVSKSGFGTVRKTGLIVLVGKTITTTLTLQVGQVAESVVVNADAIQIDTESSTVAQNVSADMFDKLPKGRSFDSLIALAPGARYESKSGGYQVDGASASENIFVIDGMDQTNIYSGNLSRTGQIPYEFVQELQIKSSGFEAQYGGAMGGVINVVTKSGSNEFHGDLGLYFSSDVLQARPRPTQRLNPENDDLLDYFQNSRDGYRLLNPGASLGGPLIKNRIFFFAGYYPEFRDYDRKVTFNSNNLTKTYYESDRNDFLNAKIDVVATSKLRTYVGYIYSPGRQRGTLPTRGGTDAPNNPWADLGSRTPAASYTFGGDYLLTSKLVFSARGGYNYHNFKNYGVPRQTAIYYSSSNKSIADVPAQWLGAAGWVRQANGFTERDIQTRFRTNADISYIANFLGQHTLKGGWEINRLHNDPNENTYPDGYLRFYWNGTYTALNGQKYKGTYGYLRYRTFQTTGNVASNNQALFLQDTWQVRRGLTLLLGLRTESEYVPSFAVANNIPSKAIEFGFDQKLAPRLGFAWDVRGDAKWKVSGSFGLFYDLMKYALPQGSFGGQKWRDFYYPLNNADPSTYFGSVPRDSAGLAADASLTGMTPVEIVNWRIPSNDPSDNTIDPNLKPMRRRVWDAGLDHQLTSTMVVSARYTHNSMSRAIEDVGTLTPEGEKYYIANPGYGITVDPKTWAPGYPVTPKAKRDYDAVEIRLDKRFSRNFLYSASYTWSRLWGNYSGLASSDEDARQDPNVSRYFDLPYSSYTAHGTLAQGLLATDRPHTFKLFASYVLKSKLGETNIGPNFWIYSGTPLTTEMFVISSVPIYVENRGDLGRTPVFSQTNLYIYHDFKLPFSERFRFRIDANFTNLFNQNTVTNRYTNYLNRNDGSYLQFDNEADFFKGFDWRKMVADQGLRLDPGYNKPNAWQGPRDIRFGFKVIF